MWKSQTQSNTFHTNISALHMFISITFTETSINVTNKTQQKVRGSKFMFKMSTIHANTCIQTTMPLRNRWWFRWQVSSLGAMQLHFLEPGVKVNGDFTGIQFIKTFYYQFSVVMLWMIVKGDSAAPTGDRRDPSTASRCHHRRPANIMSSIAKDLQVWRWLRCTWRDQSIVL